jgi:hypothetical protein
MLIFLTSGKPCITSTEGSVVREDMALKKLFEIAVGCLDLVAKEANRDASISIYKDV